MSSIKGERMLDKVIKINKDFAELRVNPKIYSKETIFATAYVFLDKAYILLDEERDKICVYLYPQDKNVNLKKISLDFYNELLNYAHYFSRAKANAEAVKSIMQRALFSAAPSLVQEAEDKEIQDLIKELEEEEKQEKNVSLNKKSKR
jgi:His-Xaa-Ser system protein HxsD